MPTRHVVNLAAGCLLALTLGACAGGGPAGAGGAPTRPAAAAATGASTTAPSRPVTPRAVLADGRHPAYVTAIRPGAGTVTLDVVEVLRDREAVKAAARAGAAYAQTYALWIENGNDRLRTLRAAPDLRIDGLIEFGTCERGARRITVGHKLRWLQGELRRHPAYTRSPYVFWVTVRGGVIHRLHLEKLNLTPAC